MTDATENSLGTVARSIELLRYFARHNETTIKKISSDLKLAPSTCHQLVNLLAREGVIEHDKDLRRYRIGPGFFRISALVTGGYDVRRLALPLLDRIVRETDETALLCLHLPETGNVLFAEKVDSSHMLRYQLQMNEMSPLLWGATGRSILAFLEPEEIARLHALGTTSPGTGEGLPPLAVLNEELQEIRSRGYAISRGQKIPGAVGLTAPFFSGGRVLGCLGITVPQSRIDETNIVALSRSVMLAASDLGEAIDRARGQIRK